MPRLNQVINVSVSECASKDGKRQWSIAVEGSAHLFVLSDSLVEEGALKDFGSTMRSVIRNAVAEYIASGRQLVKKFADREKEKSEAA